MLVYNDCINFIVMGQEVSLISDIVGDIQNTVAEISGSYYYLGNEIPNILTAIIAWEYFSGRDMTEAELVKTMEDNNLTSK